MRYAEVAAVMSSTCFPHSLQPCLTKCLTAASLPSRPPIRLLIPEHRRGRGHRPPRDRALDLIPYLILVLARLLLRPHRHGDIVISTCRGLTLSRPLTLALPLPPRLHQVAKEAVKHLQSCLEDMTMTRACRQGMGEVCEPGTIA